MNQSARDLPEFENPPVNEVVLGVQFAPVEGLTASHLGLFWSEIRHAFPMTEEKPALDPVIERFGDKPIVAGPQLRVLEAPETPRAWFLNSAGDQLIQLQRDRLLHNWRKREDSARYPRYHTLRSSFKADFESLEGFVARERIGTLRPNQCEITYINNITKEHDELEEVFETWNAPRGGFLPSPEDGMFNTRFVIRSDDGSPLGRLHVQVVPAYLKKDDSPLLKMDLTVRGRPENEGIEGILRFLDRGHEWIVRAFTELTKPAMHKVWGRSDA